MNQQSYISQALKQIIETELNTYNNMGGLSSIVTELDNAYKIQNYRDFHIALRNLGEYVRSIYGASSLSNILGSPLCNFTSDADAKNYKVVLDAIDEISKSYIESFHNSPKEMQEKELNIIGSQAFIASNFLHKTPNRIELIVDESTIPPAYQTHLLISICRQGIINKHGQKKSITTNQQKWTKGILYFSDDMVAQRQEEALVEFFYAVFDDKPLSEDLKKIESLHIAYLILTANFKKAIKQVKILNKNTTKKDHINRHFQLRLLLMSLYFFDENYDEAINYAEKLYSDSKLEYPHIAQQALFFLRREQIINHEYETKEDWHSKHNEMEFIPHPNDLNSNKVAKTFYAEINRKTTGSIAIGGHIEPILNRGVIEISRQIVSTCSYGLALEIPSKLSELLQYFLIQIDIGSTKENTIAHLIKMLPKVFLLPCSNDETMKAIIRIAVQHATEESITQFFKIAKQVNCAQYISLLTQLVSFADQKEVNKIHSIIWEQYTTELIPREYMFHTYKTTFFSLWLQIVNTSQELLTEKVILSLPIEIRKIFKLLLINEILSPLENVLVKISKTANTETKKIYKELCCEIAETSDDGSKFFWTYYACQFGASPQAFYENLSCYSQWKLTNRVDPATYDIFTPEDAAHLFYSEILSKLAKKSYSSNDYFTNHFDKHSYEILKYCEEDQDSLDFVVYGILKIINSRASESDFTGDRPDLFWKKIYLLFCSNIPNRAKEILFRSSLHSVKNISMENYKQFSMQDKIIMHLDFYKIVLTSLVTSEPIEDNIYFSMILDTNRFHGVNEIIGTYPELYRHSTETQQIFFASYMVNFISTNNNPTNVYHMAFILSNIVKEKPSIMSMVKPYMIKWAYRIQALFM